MCVCTTLAISLVPRLCPTKNGLGTRLACADHARRHSLVPRPLFVGKRKAAKATDIQRRFDSGHGNIMM